VLHLLVDTSTWLDLAKRRDGRRWIVAIRALVHEGVVELLVPSVVVEEFERNRQRVEASMTASVAQRFRLIKQDLDDYGGSDDEHALRVIEGLAHQIPLIGPSPPGTSTRSWSYCAGVAPSSPATRSDVV
jgi:predicted nucleic acid-binding protein